jgi:predicted membrane-bound spermidine synthase
MVLFLFFCSGATALIYEVLWSKYLSLIFGSTVQAQTTVLAVFMGGLALGNRLFGKRSDSVSSPLRVYGCIEIAIGLYAYAFEWLYYGADAMFVWLGSPFLGRETILLAIKGVLSACLLLGPTILMGGTLPLIAAWLHRKGAEPGRLSARFYAVNTLGAVCGAGLAGFYLLKTFGLVATALLTGFINIVIGVVAIMIARRQQPVSASQSKSVASAASQPLTHPLLRRGTILVAVTGAVSMGLELLAARALALIFGSSLQSFAVVLMAFILGIGLGSAVFASRRWSRVATGRLVTALLVTAGTWISLLVFRIEFWVEWYRWAKSGLSAGDVGYLYYELLTGAMAILLLGLPASMIGAVLPLMMRTISETEDAFGNQIGRLLTWNTLGAVAGVLLTGFALMPVFGLRTSFNLLALLLVLAAVIEAGLQKQRVLMRCSVGIAAFLLFLSTTGGDRWKLAISSASFRLRESTYDPATTRDRPKHYKLLFYKDAPDATVSVERKVANNEVLLRINGKTDASSEGDLPTQFLCAHLPLLARPEAKEVFQVGLGSGISGAAALAHPLHRLTIAENCEPVLQAAKFFEPHNEGVLTNSRTRILREDGRTVLKLDRQKYDVIISEPSNPWTVGIGNVFTEEFYELAASRLAEGGLMSQWFHIYEMHDGIVMLVLRTFGKVFPFFEVWETGHGDIILLGSKAPWSNDLDALRQILQRDTMRRHFAQIELETPEKLFALQVTSQRTAHAIAGEGSTQSDLFPVLEYEAPKAFYIGTPATVFKKYDERTIQNPLLPEFKRNILATFDGRMLQAVFGSYGSVNPDLLLFVKWRIATNAWQQPAPHEVVTLPSIFRPTNAPVHLAVLPDDATAEERELLETANQLASRSTEYQPAIRKIESLIRTLNASRPPNLNPVALSYFAALAARHSLGSHDYTTAERVLGLGMQINPDDEQLHYLARILQREHASKLAQAPN